MQKTYNYIKDLYYIKIKLRKEIKLLKTFKKSLKKEWHGIDCYSEMINNEFSQKYQPEWGGFYFEFKFQQFLNSKSKYKKICTYTQNKKIAEIDLDLNFNEKYLGDLKVHNKKSADLIGNDSNNISLALNKYKKIWYIVLNHDTIKDSEKKYEVTHFWNKSQGKKNLMSYCSRMKNTIKLKDISILEINDQNKIHLSTFIQGRNQDGSIRNSKIKIKSKDIDRFLIYKMPFL